MKEALNRAL